MQTEVLVDGLRFPEGPRWRDRWLYFSDMHDDAVKRVAPETGRCEVVVELSHPSGLGWLPDGRMLIVSMEDRRVMRLEADRRLVVHADLADIATAQANDMVVDEQGRAWVGNFGAAPDPESWPRFEPVPAALALVTPDGRAREASPERLAFPNGSVITPDGRTLIVAETFAAQLSAFDIEADGTLTGRRVWARLDGLVPDGICLDAEGCIWVASAREGSGLVRLREGGERAGEVETRRTSYACMLGGSDGRTLFACTADTAVPEACRAAPRASIETVRVEAARAGLP
jgi:sugar lactone lactonase YvrE